jgi:hypothetical protein
MFIGDCSRYVIITYAFEVNYLFIRYFTVDFLLAYCVPFWFRLLSCHILEN